MTPKSPTPQGISALLRKAGFEKSESSATRIKGWRNYSEGFVCRKDYAGGVEVTHMTGFARGEASGQRKDDMLARYAEAIRAAGWHTEVANRILTVTSPKEGER